jgi:thioredoxin 1
MEILHITQANFDELVLKSEKPVLLDFWAPWCGPCRMVAPIVEEIAAENESIAVGKINVDDDGPLAARFGITSIPTLILMEKGEAVKTLVGFRPKADILKQLGI